MSKCNIAREKLARFVDSLGQSSVEKVAQAGKLGLLANARTAGRIVLGNLASTAGWLARENVAAGIDYLASFGKSAGRTVASVADAEAAREYAHGFATGLAKVRRQWATGLDPDLSALEADAPRVSYDNPLAQRLADAVGTVVAAGDKPFFEAIQRVSLLSRARALATREGLRGEAFASRVRELLRRPTDEMLFLANADAAQVVAREQTGIAKAVNSAKGSMRRAAREPVAPGLPPAASAAAHAKKIGGAAGYAASEVVMPFVTTPMSVAASSVRLSPIGLAYTLAKQLHPATRSRLEAVRALAGAGVLGTGGAALGWALASEGQMTGAEVSDEERRLGAQPYSVRMGERWIPVAWLGPAAVMPVMGAIAFHYGREHPEASALEAGGMAAATFPKVISEQTFMRGVKDAMGAIDNPAERASGVVAGVARLPALLGQLSRGIDPVVRQTRAGPIAGALDRLQAQTPLSRGLPPRLDAFGEPITRHEGGAGGLAASLLDPTGSSPARSDVVYTELARLGVSAGQFGKTVHVLGKRVERTPGELRALTMEYGPKMRSALEALIRSPRYASAPDERKAQAIRNLIREWHERASEGDRRRRLGR